MNGETLWTLYLFLWLAMGGFAALQALVFRLCGMSVANVGVGFPALLKFKWGGVQIALGPLPFMAHAGSDQYAEAPKRRKLLVILTPWVLQGLLVLILLRPVRGFRHLVLGVWQLLSGAFELERALELLTRFKAVMSEDPLAAFGILLSKLVVVNLLPFPLLAGGSALLVATGREEWLKSKPALLMLLYLPALALYARWIQAMFFTH